MRIRSKDHLPLAWEIFHAGQNRLGKVIPEAPGDTSSMARILGRMKIHVQPAIDAGVVSDPAQAAQLWLEQFWGWFFSRDLAVHTVPMAESLLDEFETPAEFTVETHE